MYRLLSRLSLLLVLLCSLSGCYWVGPTLLGLSNLGTSSTVQPPDGLTTPPPMPSADSSSVSELQRLLSYVPNDPIYRDYLTFGDVTAWYSATAMTRVTSVADWEALEQPQHDEWSFVLSSQTLPPEVLGLRYLIAEDMRDFYGFSFFDAERFLEAGMPPTNFTVVQTRIDPAQIEAALLEFGYTATPVTGGTLYSIRGDSETDLRSPSRVGQLGQLNRIIVLGNTLVIGRATDVVTRASASGQRNAATLADDASYRALTGALAAPEITAWGKLVGAILIGQPLPDDPLVMLDQTNEALQAQLDRYAAAPLPPYLALGFATQRAGAESYLTLAVVFPPSVDGEAAATILGDRLATYESLVSQRPLAEFWSLAQQTSVEIEGLPVALVTLQATPEDGRPPFAWSNMVFQRDLLFLLTGTPVRPE